MERVVKRNKVHHGTTQDNYCDVCGLQTKVYAFPCEGDDALHMYCYFCAEAVSNALEDFLKGYRV